MFFGEYLLIVIFINKIDNDFYYGVFFFGTTFSYHKGECDKGIICYTLRTIFIV